MTWDKTRGEHDQALSTCAWRKLREQVASLRLPCARCGRAIDYAGPRYTNGRQNPAAYVLGHKLSRREARARSWTEAMIHSPGNLQAECQSCSNKSGARLGRKLQHTKPIEPFAPFTDRW